MLSEIGTPRVCREYVDYQLCKEMGWTPEYVESMDQTTYSLYLGFMRAEGYAMDQKSRRKKG